MVFHAYRRPIRTIIKYRNEVKLQLNYAYYLKTFLRIIVGNVKYSTQHIYHCGALKNQTKGVKIIQNNAY